MNCCTGFERLERNLRFTSAGFFHRSQVTGHSDVTITEIPETHRDRLDSRSSWFTVAVVSSQSRGMDSFYI